MPEQSSNLDLSRAILLRLFPDFRENMAASLYANDHGEFTEHGLWAEFSDFFRENSSAIEPWKMAELFAFIEPIVAADPEDKDGLANALCTCFLENISCTPAGEASRQFMSPSSTAFFDRSHVAPFD